MGRKLHNIDLGTEPDEVTSRVDRMQRRQWLRCVMCPPHRGENATRYPSHGPQKPRYKTTKRAARAQGAPRG